ncbi:uncharacterized protein [Centruroides vittatus]|uniref:uncharacterized protein n=1 Tax=Centruroides vittatus TaxID=120091 RepID=UPI00350EC34D
MFSIVIFVLAMPWVRSADMLSEESHHISTINPGSYEFRVVPDHRQHSASAHGIHDVKHIEALFSHFPQFPASPKMSESLDTGYIEQSPTPFSPEEFSGRLVDRRVSRPGQKKKKTTVGQIITKLNHLQGRTRAEEYPKIFRFSKTRINLEDFDRRKKLEDTSYLNKGDELDPKNIPRDKFLVIHGGIYDRNQPLIDAKSSSPVSLSGFSKVSELSDQVSGSDDFSF